MNELIKVYKISFDNAYYYDVDFPFEPEVGTIVEVVMIDKDFYENLPEFQGF